MAGEFPEDCAPQLRAAAVGQPGPDRDNRVDHFFGDARGVAPALGERHEAGREIANHRERVTHEVGVLQAKAAGFEIELVVEIEEPDAFMALEHEIAKASEDSQVVAEIRRRCRREVEQSSRSSSRGAQPTTGGGRRCCTGCRCGEFGVGEQFRAGEAVVWPGRIRLLNRRRWLSAGAWDDRVVARGRAKDGADRKPTGELERAELVNVGDVPPSTMHDKGEVRDGFLKMRAVLRKRAGLLPAKLGGPD